MQTALDTGDFGFGYLELRTVWGAVLISCRAVGRTPPYITKGRAAGKGLRPSARSRGEMFTGVPLPAQCRLA